MCLPEMMLEIYTNNIATTLLWYTFHNKQSKYDNNWLTVIVEELKSSPSLDRSVVMGRRLNFTLGAVPLSDPFSGERITVQIPCGGKVNMVGIRNWENKVQTCYIKVEIPHQLEAMCRLHAHQIAHTAAGGFDMLCSTQQSSVSQLGIHPCKTQVPFTYTHTCTCTLWTYYLVSLSTQNMAWGVKTDIFPGYDFWSSKEKSHWQYWKLTKLYLAHTILFKIHALLHCIKTVYSKLKKRNWSKRWLRLRSDFCTCVCST